MAADDQEEDVPGACRLSLGLRPIVVRGSAVFLRRFPPGHDQAGDDSSISRAIGPVRPRGKRRRVRSLSFQTCAAVVTSC